MKEAKTEVLSPSMLDEVLDGLQQPQKSLPSKLFYDERGSRLFDAICKLDEYYPTRTEISILNENIREISNLIGRNNLLVELGSGSSTKIRLLLDHNPDLAAYIPIDISEEFLYKSADVLKDDYPGIHVIPYCADYTQPIHIPNPEVDYRHKVVFYPGSTIGNFKKNEAHDFLGRISRICGENGGLLIGVDLKKDINVLEAAYNDSKGVTAEFNLNILHRLNNELNADFNIDEFEHKAIYNDLAGRIEMHLISKKNQKVTIQDSPIEFRKNETIHTENSYKYTIEEFADLASDFFRVNKIWTDPQNYFSIQFLTVR